MPKIANNNSGYFQIRESPTYRPGDMGITNTFVGHPDTEPARIREIHRDDVYHCVMVLDTLDVDMISSWVMLPKWNVQRALDSLGLVPMIEPPKKRGPQPKKLTTKDKLLKVLANGRWVSLHRLIELSSIKKETIVATMNQNPDAFEKRVRISTMNQQQRYYRLRTNEAKA